MTAEMTFDTMHGVERTGAGIFQACYLAEVVAVESPPGPGRVKVRLLSFNGVEGQDGPVWARVAVPFAGNGYGAFMLPNRGEEVLVSFVNGDPRMPIVVGSLWNGAAPPPEPSPGRDVACWSLVGRAGTRIAIVEEENGNATISLTTPGGVGCVLQQGAGGSIEIQAAGSTLTIDTAGVRVETPAQVRVQASTVDVTAGQVTVNAAMSRFNGVVNCDTLIATSVVASTYTPGAGNIW